MDPHPGEIKFLDAAEKAIGRPLSAEESKCVEGYGQLAESMLDLYKTKEDFEKLFVERRALRESTQALEELASDKEQALDALKNFITRQDPRRQELLRALNIPAQIERFSDWLLRSVKSNPPPANVKIFYFGLAEKFLGSKCVMYVMGGPDIDTLLWDNDEELPPIESPRKLWRDLEKGRRAMAHQAVALYARSRHRPNTRLLSNQTRSISGSLRP
jgi:hypothetical protein